MIEQIEQSEQLQVMYEVESILKKRMNGQNKPLYLIKWKGWKEKTWQPIEHLFNVPEMIYQFQQSEKRNRRIEKETTKSINHLSTPIQPQKSKIIKKRKLKKMSDPVYESPSSEQQQEQHLSKEIPVQNIVSDRATNLPRIKVTQEYLKLGNDRNQNRNGKGNIYLNQIQKIVKIDRRDDKWMVLVKFIEGFEDSWEERDIIRMLYPHKLLTFYEEMYRKKEQK